MNAPLILQPNAIERAYDRVTDAARALDELKLRDAAAFMREAVKILETEDQFREARKGQAT